MTKLTRRDFLKVSATAGFAAATAPFASRALAAAPFSHAGPPRLRLSLTAFSLQRYFTMNRGKAVTGIAADKALDMFKFVDYCAVHGLDGAELTSYYFAEDTAEYMVKLRRHCFLRGIAISGTAIANNFSLSKGTARDQDIAHVKKWINLAAVLGAPHIRVFIGQNNAVSRAEADKLAIAGLEECGNYAGRHGIFLGIENHDVSNSAARLIPILQAIQSPWVGLNIDPGINTADPYRDFAACVPYALNIHLRTEFEAAGKKYNTDFKRLGRLLRDGGYQGWVAYKHELQSDPLADIPPVLKDMKALQAG
jgi:sugar phosphate isomerase/epimerase